MAGGRIAELSVGKTVIVDTHYTIKIGTGSYLQGVPSWVSDSLNPKLLVLIETTAEEVTQRRSKDKSRKRDEDVLELLDEHQNLNRTVASTICQKTGALISIIKNRHGKADEAGKALFKQLKAM
jgi:adenylate kinase